MTELSRSDLPRWVELREQQHAAVVQAILALVSEGSTQLKVADLAERAGMSRPTFYKYFPTVGAAMLHTERVLLGAMEQFVAQTRSPDKNAREQLLERFELTFEYTCAHPEVVRFFTFFDFTFERFGLAESERTEQLRISSKAGNPLYELFCDGQADGSIDPTLPRDITYLSLISSLVGIRQRLCVEAEWTNGVDQTAREAHSTLVNVWRQALLPPPPNPHP
ncbi:TetR/AcrR family transcriptional regulator [Nocardia vinacea]|uniref:TetR/AcrR family transcriptional regulator n=1 Tax=Nocardia vinacea TaxID=96468 RepID=A0ABZ1YS84_9NOCA|nr:TetR/AcrR family transcriptional regulator [Nocardia vinacea]